ncbi:MAG TPA: hypothetical protein VKT78_02575 [Fimbriimonadaceae bacterium]|nr:hypothetical protein [Fimbriimonadaceae bacterium]
MSYFVAALVIASAQVRQPTLEPQGRWKLVLRNLAIPGLPASSYLVISQPDNGDGPISVRLTVDSKPCSRVKLPDGLFNSRSGVRLFRRGGDYLLAFGSGTGTTLLTHFVRITARPRRLIPELNAEGTAFQYAPLHHFQIDGRFDEHLRHRDATRGLYTRHWRWSNRKHRFVVTGISHLRGWDGWGDESLR